MAVTINRDDFRKRVMGCWLGKAIGGTLGQPYELQPGPLNLTYYNPVPTGTLPNDDLDLQVLWAVSIDRIGPNINRTHLAKAWADHTDFPWDEYGSASANFKRKIMPPLSGHFSNFFGDCMGSPIRSEIWAVLAPGDPQLACELAYEDAIIDHDGEGIWGEIFLAAMESAAFVNQDREQLLDIGLSAIPKDSKIFQVVTLTREAYAKNPDWLDVRAKILEKFHHPNATDAPQNLGFIVLGLLAGKDFGDSILTAVNCGQDTDCTGASLGALLGIIDPEGIEEKWKKPISEEINLLHSMKNITSPKTLTELADLTVKLSEQMLEARSTKAAFGENASSEKPVFEIKGVNHEPANSMLITDGPLRITAVYPEGISFIPGQNIPLTLEFTNKTDSQINADLNLILPPTWKVSSHDSKLSLKPNQTKKLNLQIDIPANIINYEETVTLCLSKDGIYAEYDLPFIRSWPWQIQIGDEKKLIWQPERVILPLQTDELKLKDNEPLRLSTNFRFPRSQFVRIILTSNGSATLTLDGEKIIDYTDSVFMPATHRMPEGTARDIDLKPGWHTIEISVQCPKGDPQAALLFADSKSRMMLTDIEFAPDKPE